MLGTSEYRPEPRRGGRGPIGPREIAKQVETMSKQRRLSDNRVLVELIEQGIQARKEKEKAFFELAKRFREANDPKEVEQLGDQMGRFVFGE